MLFGGHTCPFSNFFPAVIRYGHHTFANSESFFQFRKLMFPGDTAKALRIVNSNDPLEAKKFGDSVDVTTEDWLKVSRTVMSETLFAKYEQNPNLKELLVSTGNHTIVECNKYDKIWGIRLHLTDARCQNPASWIGKNWLGQSLMEVRKLNTLYVFSLVPGLNLNYQKTEILKISVPLTIPKNIYNVKWEKEKVYALGTWFYKDNNQTVFHNYTSKLKHMEQSLQKWLKLNVTLQCKINAFKTHALSKIIYLIGSLSTPKWVIKDLEDIQYRFIWSNLKRKLKHNVLIANYNEGGLKLTDIPSYVKPQKVNWIKRFLVNDNNVIPELSINHYLMWAINPKHVVHPISTFY